MGIFSSKSIFYRKATIPLVFIYWSEKESIFWFLEKLSNGYCWCLRSLEIVLTLKIDNLNFQIFCVSSMFLINKSSNWIQHSKTCGVGWLVCDTLLSLDHWSYEHLSTASNWIGIQTGVHGFDSPIPFKIIIWVSSYDHLTEVAGQRGGCQHLLQRKSSCFLLNKKEALRGLNHVPDDEERNGGQA